MADKHERSRANQQVERSALDLLLTNPRIQAPGPLVRKALLLALGVTGNFGARSFDCVLTEHPSPPLSEEGLVGSLDTLRLVEMKSTKAPIRSTALNGFFFGATAREFDLAKELGDKYLFAFVVLNSGNDYGRPFAVLLTLAQLEARIRTKRVQFQVNLRTDIPEDEAIHEFVVIEPPTAGPLPSSLP